MKTPKDTPARRDLSLLMRPQTFPGNIGKKGTTRLLLKGQGSKSCCCLLGFLPVSRCVCQPNPASLWSSLSPSQQLEKALLVDSSLLFSNSNCRLRLTTSIISPHIIRILERTETQHSGRKNHPCFHSKQQLGRAATRRCFTTASWKDLHASVTQKRI